LQSAISDAEPLRRLLQVAFFLAYRKSNGSFGALARNFF
jgi:hypothetical protein